MFASRFGVRAYDYWWGYSSAQIDLMVIDQPLVVYPKDKDAPAKHTKRKMDESYDKWLENKKSRGGQLKGEKISLNEYLRTKIDK